MTWLLAAFAVLVAAALVTGICMWQTLGNYEAENEQELN